ncbi:MAG TPA: hypothetical protein PKO06_11780 [Candidatus Ozemobacteraceae bacterium]|nr:hypothetical protein [Candidatus Ozemobacteraceae bacterium]
MVRTVLIIGVLGCFLCVVLFVTNQDAIRRYIRSHVKVAPQKNSLDLDLKSLDLAHVQGTMNLSVFNGLPVGATLVKLQYSVFMNGAEICHGLQAHPQAPIAPTATSTLKISFSVDSQKVRAAIGRTTPEQAIALGLNLIDRMKGKKPLTNSLKGLIRISGNAEIQVFTSSVDIPVEFSRNL